MNIIFMGSPEIAIYPLEYLLSLKEEKVNLIATISQPARAVGRGNRQILVDPPVAAYSKKQAILTFQPPKASDPLFIDMLRRLEPDIIVTCAYGQILSREFLTVAKRATINIHPSLLPQYRGATPIQSALLHGDSVTGVSILFTIFKLDAGALICSDTFPIDPKEKANELSQRLFKASGPLLKKALQKLEDPNFEGDAQDEEKVTFCQKIEKHQGALDWSLDIETLFNQYRAYTPWPGLYTYFGSKRIVLEEMEPLTQGVMNTQGNYGSVCFDKKSKYLRISCKNGVMGVLKLKPEGSRSISAESFWNGLKFKEQVIFKNELLSPIKD